MHISSKTRAVSLPERESRSKVYLPLLSCLDLLDLWLRGWGRASFFVCGVTQMVGGFYHRFFCVLGSHSSPFAPLGGLSSFMSMRRSSFQGVSDGGESEMVGFYFWMGGGTGDVLAYASLVLTHGWCLFFGMVFSSGGGYRCPGADVLGLG